MIKKSLLSLILLTAFLFFSSNISAQTKVRVRFAKGEISSIVKGKISGYRYVDYIVKAQSGQKMTASLNSAHLGCSFVIFYSDMKNVEDATSVTDFTRNVDVTDDYIVRVALPRSAARRKETAGFALKITIE